MNLLSQRESFFQQAVEAHTEFVKAIRTTKERAFDCGLALLNAQALCQPGEWEDLLQSQDSLPRTTAFRYMKFAGDCLIWAQVENPKLKKPEAIQSAARDMVLESALSFMALLRAVGTVREAEGGGYRSEQRKSGAPAQLWFSFDAFFDLSWSLAQQDFKPLAAALQQMDITDAAQREKVESLRSTLAQTVAQLDAVLHPQPPGRDATPLASGPTPFLPEPMGSLPQITVGA